VYAPVWTFACTEIVWHAYRVDMLRSAMCVPAREPSEICARSVLATGLVGHVQGHVGDVGVGRERVYQVSQRYRGRSMTIFSITIGLAGLRSALLAVGWARAPPLKNLLEGG